MSRLLTPTDMLDISFLGFGEQIFGSAPGKSHDSQCGIFIWIGDQWSAISNKKIFYVVSLAVAFYHRSFWSGAHAGRADFVNDFAAFENSKRILAINGGFCFINAAHSLDDGAESLLHILCLAQFVFRPAKMETQNGDAPLIDNVGIDFAVGMRVGNHFATSGESDGGAVKLSSAGFERGSVTLFVTAKLVEHSHARHVAAAIQLDVIAARKIILAIEFPPRDVQVHAADAIVIVRRHFFEGGDVTP